METVHVSVLHLRLLCSGVAGVNPGRGARTENKFPGISFIHAKPIWATCALAIKCRVLMLGGDTGRYSKFRNTPSRSDALGVKQILLVLINHQQEAKSTNNQSLYSSLGSTP